MAIKNISDWLSFLNERIASYESIQNTHFAFVGGIIALAVAMIGINVTISPTNQNIPLLAGQWVLTYLIIIAGVVAFLLYLDEKKSQNKLYQRALQIRAEILNERLINTDDICQQCYDARIL